MPITNDCNFSGIGPIMVSLPYPAISVNEKNPAYANLLSNDYCGAVSELSAITQYINHENRLSYEKCPLSKTILGIAIAEMIHLQKLGELIILLGGDINYTAVLQNGKRKMWTPKYLTLPEHTEMHPSMPSGKNIVTPSGRPSMPFGKNVENMLHVDIESEKAAINQYRMHIKMIKDPYINAVLERIILDEEYHILILQNLLKDFQS